MPLSPPTPELLRSLGKMLRGLSALFWGLPVALIASVQSQTFPGGQGLIALIPCTANGLLFFGLMQLAHFQPQERIWREALDRAKVLAIINTWLSPFLYFRVRLPHIPHYAIAVDVLYLSSLLFLYNYNLVLFRLTSMLPDENLRNDAKMLARWNRAILGIAALISLAYLTMLYTEATPSFFHFPFQVMEMNRWWMAVVPLLMPVAMMMTLTWKVKELVIDGVFNSGFWLQEKSSQTEIRR